MTSGGARGHRPTASALASHSRDHPPRRCCLGLPRPAGGGAVEPGRAGSAPRRRARRRRPRPAQPPPLHPARLARHAPRHGLPPAAPDPAARRRASRTAEPARHRSLPPRTPGARRRIARNAAAPAPQRARRRGAAAGAAGAGAATAAITRPPEPEPPPPAAPPKPVVGTVTGLPLPRFAALGSNQVNMRIGPDLRYRIDWTYQRRDLPVQIIEEHQIWRKIRDPEGTEGWVQRPLLNARRTFLVPGEGSAPLRRRPDAEAPPVAHLKPGRDRPRPPLRGRQRVVRGASRRPRRLAPPHRDLGRLRGGGDRVGVDQPPAGGGSPRRNSTSAAFTSPGRSCCIQCPAPPMISDRRSSGTKDGISASAARRAGG